MSPPPNDPRCEELFHNAEIDTQVDIAKIKGANCYVHMKHNTYGWCYVDQLPKTKEVRREQIKCVRIKIMFL